MGYHSALIPRNVRGCGNGDECGYCTFGCQRGAKQGALQTFLHDAYTRGARFLVDAEAERIVIGSLARAAGVQVRITGATESLTIRARVVVVAGGGIGSPALLLRSGLSNRHIGRHLSLHPTTVVIGVYDEPIEPWKGPPQSIFCNEFAADMASGLLLNLADAHPLAAAALPWTWRAWL